MGKKVKLTYREAQEESLRGRVVEFSVDGKDWKVFEIRGILRSAVQLKKSQYEFLYRLAG